MYFYLLSTTFFIIITALSMMKPRFYPPGPPFLPFIGNIHVLKNLKAQKFHHMMWHFLSSIYGEVVGLKFFNKNLVIVSGKRLIRQLYLREELTGRPNGFFFKIRSFGRRIGLVFTDGDLWEKQRTFSVKTFKTLGLGKAVMVDSIEHEAVQLIKKIGTMSTNGTEVTIQDDERNLFDISVINVMWKLLRGQRFDLDDPEALDLMEAIHKCFRVVDMSGGVLNVFPAIRHIFPTKSGYKPLLDTLKPLQDFIRRNIAEVAENIKNSQEDQNFIETYLRELQKPKSAQEYFSEDQLLVTCVDFFQAGSETTSNTLSFAMLYMLYYPEVMKKVQNELLLKLGNRLPKVSDRSELKYTEAVICEVQRMANVAPVGIAHRSLDDLVVDSFVIPKNSTVLLNIYSMHMDQTYWKNPHDFMPERFLDENENLILHENFIPFGSGKRRCIGENLAKNSLLHFFATIMHAFDMEQCTPLLPDLRGKDGITLSPSAFKARFRTRLNLGSMI